MQREDDASAHQLMRAVAMDTSTSALFRAVARGHVEEVKTLLGGGAAANERNDQQETPLYYAALSGNLEIAQLLVEHGARVDYDCRTPLFRAVEGGHQHVVTWLVEQDIEFAQRDGDDHDRWGPVAEDNEVEWEDDDECDAEECDVNEADTEEYDERCDGDTAESGEEEDEEADGDYCEDEPEPEPEPEPTEDEDREVTYDEDKQGATVEVVWKSALIGAVKRNQLHVVKWLVEQGAQVNHLVEGTCALVCAVQAGYADMIRFELDSGALPDSKNDRGRTPVFFAAHQEDVETLQLLIQHGARLDEKDANGQTPLARSCGGQRRHGPTAGGKWMVDMMTFLLNLEASIDLKDYDGRTPLFYAALKNDEAVVGYLLQHGANIDESDKSGATPLSGVVQTVSTGMLDMVQYLLRKAASINASDNQGWTPIMFAAKQGNKEIVDVLIASGANVNQISVIRKTALMLTSLGQHVSTFKSLIEAGVSVTSRGRDGETPLVSAARCDYFAGVQALVKQGGSVDPIGSEDEIPLIPGTLEAMEALCLASNEFKPMLERVVKRLQRVCTQMQAAQVDLSTLISFATILFRLCQLLLKCQLACPVLRFTGSRAVSARVQDFHEEIDHFMALNEFDSADPAHMDWKSCWDRDWKQQRKAFEGVLQDDDALLLGLSPDADWRGTRDLKIDAVTRLRYELLNRSGQYAAEDIAAIEQVLTRLQKAASIENSPLPQWYISDDGVGDRSQEDDLGRVHRPRTSGTWLKTKVMVSSSWMKVVNFEANASRWFPLSHPNVAKLYGACHTGEHTFFVYEFCLHSSLRHFLGLAENRQLTCVKLHEIARGIQYLHQRNIAHGDLRCDNFLIGADLTAKIGGFGEEEVYGTENVTWKSAELIRGNPSSSAFDIYALGMSILEAVTLESPWPQSDYIDIMMDVKRGRLPSRPKDLNPSTWEMLKKMCAFDPDERVKIAYVVQQLEVLAGNQLSNRQASPTELPHYDLKNYVMPMLGATIESTLQAMQMAVARFSESQQMAEQVLTKLTKVYNRLLSSQKSAGDIEVTKYCDVLSRFQRYLRTPASEISVARFARSRKIADSNRLFRLELDRLMNLLLVSESDSLRSWRSVFETISEEDSDESTDGAVHKEKESFDAIKLINFNTSSIEVGSPESSSLKRPAVASPIE